MNTNNIPIGPFHPLLEEAEYFNLVVDGETVVRLPEHFGLVSVEEGLTVQLTPRNVSSLGLAAVEVTTSHLIVKELFDGKGNYKFDYFIQGLRRGYENHEPIRKAQRRRR